MDTYTKTKYLIAYIICSLYPMTTITMYSDNNRDAKAKNHHSVNVLPLNFPLETPRTLEATQENAFACATGSTITSFNLHDWEIKRKERYRLCGNKTNIIRANSALNLIALQDENKIKIFRLNKKIEDTHEIEGAHKNLAGSPKDFAWNPKGNNFAILFNTHIELYAINDNTTQKIKQFPLSGFLYNNAIMFSPDGAYITFIAKKFNMQHAIIQHTIGFIDAETGNILDTKFNFDSKIKRKHMSFVPHNKAQDTGNNSLLFAVNYTRKTNNQRNAMDTSTIHVATIENNTAQITKKIPHAGPIQSIEAMPSANMLAAVAINDLIKIIDLETNTIKHILQGHTQKIKDIKFSNSWKYLVSTSKDYTIRSWKNPFIYTAVFQQNLLEKAKNKQFTDIMIKTAAQHSQIHNPLSKHRR